MGANVPTTRDHSEQGLWAVLPSGCGSQSPGTAPQRLFDARGTRATQPRDNAPTHIRTVLWGCPPADVAAPLGDSPDHIASPAAMRPPQCQDVHVVRPTETRSGQSPADVAAPGTAPQRLFDARGTRATQPRDMPLPTYARCCGAVPSGCGSSTGGQPRPHRVTCQHTQAPAMSGDRACGPGNGNEVWAVPSGCGSSRGLPRSICMTLAELALRNPATCPYAHTHGVVGLSPSGCGSSTGGQPRPHRVTCQHEAPAMSGRACGPANGNEVWAVPNAAYHTPAQDQPPYALFAFYAVQ